MGIKIIREFTRQCVIIDNCCDTVLEKDTADILLFCPLCDDCIERGLNLKEGGAVYDFISDLQVGIANQGDSLATKKCVFEDYAMTPAQLWDALMNNFAGEEGEHIRKLLIAAPKYGNDDDYVDSLTRASYDIYIDELSHYHNTRYGRGPIGGYTNAGTSSISANVPQELVPQQPRMDVKGGATGGGMSPSHAADKHGPTAVFKSISKLPTDKITAAFC